MRREPANPDRRWLDTADETVATVIVIGEAHAWWASVSARDARTTSRATTVETWAMVLFRATGTRRATTTRFAPHPGTALGWRRTEF